MAVPSPVSQLRVQAIKGKFEQLQEISYTSGPFAPPRATPPCRRRRSPFSPVDPSPTRDSPPLPDGEVGDETSGDLGVEESSQGVPRPVEPCPRPRSRSVGAPTAAVQRCWKDGGGLASSPVKKTVASRYLFSPSRRNENGEGEPEMGSADPLRLSSSDNFCSFSEKQKLVESIVLNIRSSSAKKKKEQEQDQRSKDFKARDILMSTSKFEKNLKNVLERGVRKKWNERAIRDDNKQLRETFLEENQESDLGIIRQKRKQILNHNGNGTNQQKSFSKINSILGVKLYPLDSRNSDERVSKNCQEGKRMPKSEVTPATSSKSNRITNESCLYEGSHPPRRPTGTWQGVPEESSSEKPRFEFDQTTTHSGRTTKPEPIRPPRKRRGKKGMAPQPPLSPFVDLNDRSSSPERRSDQEHPSPVTAKDEDEEKVSEKREEIKFPEEDKPKECDDPAFFSLSYESSSCDVGKDFNYEEHCESHLENEAIFYDKESKSMDGTLGESLAKIADTDESNCDHEQLFSSCRGMSMSEPSLDVSPSVSSGVPPKKPPRTFAYDIYRALKSDEVEDDSQAACLAPKLSPIEVESLYTKPLKKLKEKPPSPMGGGSSAPSKSTTDQSTTKPAIAPKPLDIITRAKQRLSVSEPLPSAAESKEFSDCKPPVKRNSSFRFSFRKHKKSSNSPPRPINLRLDNQVGKKLKVVTRNLQPKKIEKEKRVRFQSGCNKKLIYDDVDEGPIYAVPNLNEVRPSEKPQELHYMCSPLFHDDSKASRFFEDDSNGALKENCPPSPQRWELRDRLRIMDGFKQDLRQSCRLVQKRLKGTNAGNRHHHR